MDSHAGRLERAGEDTWQVQVRAHSVGHRRVPRRHTGQGKEVAVEAMWVGGDQRGQRVTLTTVVPKGPWEDPGRAEGTVEKAGQA